VDTGLGDAVGWLRACSVEWEQRGRSHHPILNLDKQRCSLQCRGMERQKREQVDCSYRDDEVPPTDRYISTVLSVACVWRVPNCPTSSVGRTTWVVRTPIRHLA
jgi:hypothetical protein